QTRRLDLASPGRADWQPEHVSIPRHGPCPVTRRHRHEVHLLDAHGYGMEPSWYGALRRRKGPKAPPRASAFCDATLLIIYRVLQRARCSSGGLSGRRREVKKRNWGEV